ncbi:unnamed protein product, partial [Prorocentrum cordatum]
EVQLAPSEFEPAPPASGSASAAAPQAALPTPGGCAGPAGAGGAAAQGPPSPRSARVASELSAADPSAEATAASAAAGPGRSSEASPPEGATAPVQPTEPASPDASAAPSAGVGGSSEAPPQRTASSVHHAGGHQDLPPLASGGAREQPVAHRQEPPPPAPAAPAMRDSCRGAALTEGAVAQVQPAAASSPQPPRAASGGAPTTPPQQAEADGAASSMSGEAGLQAPARGPGQLPRPASEDGPITPSSPAAGAAAAVCGGDAGGCIEVAKVEVLGRPRHASGNASDSPLPTAAAPGGPGSGRATLQGEGSAAGGQAAAGAQKPPQESSGDASVAHPPAAAAPAAPDSGEATVPEPPAGTQQPQPPPPATGGAAASPQPAQAAAATPDGGACGSKQATPAAGAVAPVRPADGPQVGAEGARLRAAVQQDRRDFEAWSRLLELVERSGSDDAEALYSDFLEEFPLCWGYWKRLAELVAARRGAAEALAVYERGASVAAPCVDLWLHYCDAARAAVGNGCTESDARAVFARALSAAGLDWRAGPLWERCVDFEQALGNWSGVGEAFRRALAVPMQGLPALRTRLQRATIGAQGVPLDALCSAEEAGDLLALRQSFGPAARPSMLQEVAAQATSATEHAFHQQCLVWFLNVREAQYQRSFAEARVVAPFEQSIKRPYFHNKPLSSMQLNAWRSYLDFELNRQPPDQRRIEALFQRCLVACNNYLEFWLRGAAWLEGAGRAEDACQLLGRGVACGRLRGCPAAVVACAELEELCGRPQRAREHLEGLLEGGVRDGTVEAGLRLFSLELRAGGPEAGALALEGLLGGAKDLSARGVLARQLARLCEDALGAPERGGAALRAAWD